MRPGRCLAVVAAWIAVATAGCGLGPGESSEGEATLAVTRDFGTEPMLEATVDDPTESETVIRFLDREADITTRYGGGFVQSIDGLSGEIADGRSSDWFFFVNGIEADRGSAEFGVRGGDRIWWDYRDWTNAMRAPAVVGSWPEPFAQAATPDADRAPVELSCVGQQAPCDEVSTALQDAGVEVAADAERDGGGPRVLVGPWDRVRADPVAAQLDQGPATSGVFARFDRDAGGWSLNALDVEARASRDLGPDAGLVAAMRRADDAATWVVTGGDDAGVERAAELLDEADLEQRYAVAAAGDEVMALPDVGSAG